MTFSASETSPKKGRPPKLVKHDCHTCVEQGQKCDRAWPHCQTCHRSGKVCGGFAMQLSWQPGFSTHRKPSKRTILRRSRWEATTGDVSGGLQLKFINEYPGEAKPNNNNELAAALHRQVRVIQSAAAFNHTSNATTDRTLEATLVTDRWRNNQFAPINLSDDIDGSNIVPGSLFTDRPYSDLQARTQHFRRIPASVMYNGHFERLEYIFERYNNEFSVIPLTLNLPLNPFRYREDSLQGSDFLLRAVLALSCHHTENLSTHRQGDQISETVLNHSRTALRLLRQALNSNNVAWMSASLLDTIIVLFSLDEAESLFGSWTTHLTGAYNILELDGGIPAWTKNPRTVVQVALLTWWDAVTSLVNRTPCVFPYEYFEAVLASSDDRFWTYFGLCGCPQSLAVPAVQLAHLAAEKQKTASMRWVAFDSSLVSEIEQTLEAWSHTPSDTVLDDEESIHQDMERMHCSEAWRNGLLLYIYRVFWWKPADRLPGQVVARARTILDHACSCRDDQFLARQALLPLFFAGCEMADVSAQNRIKELCSLWNERTRYHMFGTMIPLLEQVWAARQTHGPEHVWWGQIVDKTISAQSSSHSPKMGICFG